MAPMTEIQVANSRRLRSMIDAYQTSQVIATFATLGVADVLASAEHSPATIADKLGVDPGALNRLLRAAAELDLVRKDSEDRYVLTPCGHLLYQNDPNSVRAWAMHAGQPYMWEAWARLLQSVQTGAAAFPQVHGTDVWVYRARHPEAGRIFDGAMADSRDVAVAIADAYVFPETGTVVDIGGGCGTLLATILARRPALHGILLERQEVAERARTTLLEAGLGDRCTVAAGDFFTSAPERGDIYVLKGVLHDWDDLHAEQILRSCRGAMSPKSRLLVIERVAGSRFDLAACMMDLHMLVVHGGLERTEAHFKRLLESASFSIIQLSPTASGLTIIQARPSEP